MTTSPRLLQTTRSLRGLGHVPGPATAGRLGGTLLLAGAPADAERAPGGLARSLRPTDATVPPLTDPLGGAPRRRRGPA